MELLDEIKRGEEAQRLMDHPIFKEAMQKVESGILDAMKESGLGDESTHNKLVISLQIMEQIKRHMKTTMETGKLARIQFEKENTLQKLKKAAGFRS